MTSPVDPYTCESAEGFQSGAPATSETSSAPVGGEAERLPARTCRRCGVVEQGTADRCRSCGTFLPANSVALRHGRRRRVALPGPETSELFLAYAADLGGDLSAGQRVLLARLVEADRIAQTCSAWLGSTRAKPSNSRVLAVVGALLSAAQTTARLALALGLERRARQLPSLAEYLRDRQREAEADADSGAEP